METILGIILIVLAAIVAIRFAAVIGRVALGLALIGLGVAWWLHPAHVGAVVAAVGRRAVHVVERVVG